MLYTLPISLWFASFNANRICSTGYKWGPQRCKTNQSVNNQNYRTKKVVGEHIKSLEQCGSQLVEQFFVESTKKY
jgi:hypothetical protein